MSSPPPPQLGSGRKRPASGAGAVAHSTSAAPSIAAAANPGVRPPSAASRMTVTNPYAKKKKSLASSSSVANPYARRESASSASSKVAARPPSLSNPRCDRATAEAYAIRPGRGGIAGDTSQRAPPPPVDENSFATFSQAFGDVEDTEQFHAEMEAVRGSDAVESLKRSERAAQRAFNAADATEEPGTHESGKVSARDNHLALQPHVLHVSTKQRGNSALKYVRNVPFSYSTMVPDYIFAPNRCALFLSIKYHNLHPTYIHRRISELGTDFDLRVLLCLVDVDDNAATLLFLNKMCVVNNLTLVLAWSSEEAARYLETLKAFEGKDATSIQRREQTNFSDQIGDVLCAVRSVNKTDATQLISQFGSLQKLMAAPIDELSLCPGVGEKKVKRLYEAFHKPFSSAAARRRRKEAEGGSAV